jgi:hypothetical protein
MNDKIKCQYCDKDFSKYGLHIHIDRIHKGINKYGSIIGLGNTEKNLTKRFGEIQTIEKICEKCNKSFLVVGRPKLKWIQGIRFCNRSCANARVWSEEDKQKKRKSAKSSEKAIIARSKAVKLKALQRTKQPEKICPICQVNFNNYSHRNAIYCSKKCYLADSEHKFRRTGMGGYREGSGRSKFGYYKGIYCSSTYELAWVIYNLDHRKEVKRFDGYLTDGLLKYYPDFIQNGTIIEIKGFVFDESVQKKKELAESQGYIVKILNANDLQDVFSYVGNKFGLKIHSKNCHKLAKYYDNHKPKFTYICNFCGDEFTRDIKAKTVNVFCSRWCSGKKHGGKKRACSTTS